MPETLRHGEIARQGRDFVGGEINKQAFRNDERVSGPALQLREQFAAGIHIREVQPDPLEAADRFFISQHLLFVREDFRQIDFHPVQGRRQLHSIRASIESSREIDHQVRAAGDAFVNKLVDRPGARDKGPGMFLGKRNGSGDLLAPLPGEAAGKWIAKDRVRPFRLARPVNRHPARGVGDAANL